MKQAIVNILNALADRIRPCGHQWELWRAVRFTTDDGNTNQIDHMFCNKCGKITKIVCR